jgi:single-strand DNA-binding protein
MSKATMTIEGFVAKDPEIRDVNGQQVATVTVPHQARRKNRDTGQFEDVGDVLWVQAAFWGNDAIAITHAARKGELVTITGQPELHVYTKNDNTTGAQLRLKFATLGVIPRAAKAPAANTWDAANNTTTTPAADDWVTGGAAYVDDQTPF